MRAIKYLPSFPYNMTESRERAKVVAGRVWRANRHFLPYGYWVCANGREVLFDRQYRPLFERARPGATAVIADVGEWVKEITFQAWFYSDMTPERKKRENSVAVLREWGVVT